MTIIDEHLSVHGLEAIELDNGRLRVLVLPTAGGRVWQVQCLRTGRRLLWNNPRIAPGRLPIGSRFDDTFSGGWDELFPNDLPETLAGEDFPDHGELWTASWAWRTQLDEHGDASVELTLETPISQCRFRKLIRLRSGSDRLEVEEEVTNVGPRDLPALWKQHLALAVAEGDHIELPGGRAELADWGSPRAGVPGVVYDWPNLEGHDLSSVPAAGPAVEFQYVTQLPETWCGLRHRGGGGLRLQWCSDQVDSVWLFASHGGWRGIRTVVLEPCTGWPLSVSAGVEAGTHRVLHPGETWKLTMRLGVHEDEMPTTPPKDHP
ncbi:hypothetical protein [Aestuariimicrobium sp. T2.26MG-19.2B]|uniref:hypothetical protein n=1 Tax=Aestuariimicrobium sp. T2.26MG-19.2B TaxID=3040679 RepID=UPI002477C0D5|nr:hypothetical protein [Aestuariimicrobium sp. T2.26MG-19.2B]CAI9400835.1 hypothetical protein AESSP_00471 [Aestuariimicrobium sp. T2.26MG-19.2B]